MRVLLKSVIIGVVCEAIALPFLLFGKWEFMGEVDAWGKIGVLLHLPGLYVAGLARLENFGWIAILGVPLLLWIVIAWGMLSLLRVFRRPAA